MLSYNAIPQYDYYFIILKIACTNLLSRVIIIELNNIPIADLCEIVSKLFIALWVDNAPIVSEIIGHTISTTFQKMYSVRNFKNHSFLLMLFDI